MKNKEMIKKLKENSELAWASYGYYDLIGKKFHTQSKTRKGEFITLHDIMDATYFDYETQDSTFFNTFKLKGDMTPTQAKRFFSRYDLLIHQPNTTSGFSATLFEDLGELEKELDNKTNTRKSTTLFQDKESKEYILAIRGTELKQGIFNDTQDNNQKIISIRGKLDNKTNTRKKLEKDRQYILAIRGTELKQGIFNDTQDNNQKIISIRGKLDNKTNTRKSATLFQDKESKEYTFAIRGTELKQGIFNDTQDNNQKIISIRGKLDNKTNTRKSATLFQDKESKEYTFAIRGTELKQGIFNDTQDNNQKIISIRGKLDNKTNTRKSTTLFQDKESKEYILAIRDTELKQGIFNDIAEADVSLALNSLPNHQYIDMLRNLL